MFLYGSGGGSLSKALILSLCYACMGSGSVIVWGHISRVLGVLKMGRVESGSGSREGRVEGWNRGSLGGGGGRARGPAHTGLFGFFASLHCFSSCHGRYCIFSRLN